MKNLILRAKNKINTTNPKLLATSFAIATIVTDNVHCTTFNIPVLTRIMDLIFFLMAFGGAALIIFGIGKLIFAALGQDTSPREITSSIAIAAAGGVLIALRLLAGTLFAGTDAANFISG